MSKTWTFYVVNSTPLFCFLAASEDLRTPVDRPLTAQSNKTDGPHKMFMFLTSVDKSITNRFLMSSRWKWPKNDIIRTIIKDITWEIFLQSSKPVSLKIVRFQLFSAQLIGRTPGIHLCHFHIDTMKNKQIQIL